MVYLARRRAMWSPGHILDFSGDAVGKATLSAPTTVTNGGATSDRIAQIDLAFLVVLDQSEWQNEKALVNIKARFFLQTPAGADC